jgi:hypothetical protein
MSVWISEVLTDKSFLVCATITLVCVVPSICSAWSRARRHELDTQLKDSMIARGMSADEIVRVLDAGKKPASPGQSSRSSDFGVEFERTSEGDKSPAPVLRT